MQKNHKTHLECGAHVIHGKYIITQRISAGTYGIVYRGKNRKTNNDVAIKFAAKTEGRSTLSNEARIMIRLQRKLPLPLIRDYGEYTKGLNYLVMDLLGPPLFFNIISQREIEVDKNNERMSITVLDFCIQLLNIIEIVHSYGFVYRDIKPSNFLFGLPPNDRKIHIIDFGLVKCFHAKDGTHIREKQGVTPVGTKDYMSIRTHMGYEISRRDDLESLGYLFQYMHHGTLSWHEITDPNSIIQHKLSTVDVPANISQYMRSVRALKFDERPNYEMLRRCLSNIVIF